METKNRDSPVVYIASPFAGDEQHNTVMARRYCRYAVDQGCIPIAPHLWLPGILSEETERDLAIDMDLRLLDLCNEIWICGETISNGMRVELKHALSTGIPVRFVEEEELNVRD